MLYEFSKKIGKNIITKVLKKGIIIRKKMRGQVVNNPYKNVSKDGVIYLIDTFHTKDNIIFIEGQLDEKLIDKNISIVIKLRKRNKSYTYPLNRTVRNRWSFKINLSNMETVFSGGLWDFYILEEETKVKYRVRVGNENLLNDHSTFIYNTEKESRFLDFYITLNNGFSFISNTDIFRVSMNKVNSNGSIFSYEGDVIKDLSLEYTGSLKIVFRQRNTGIFKEYPIYIYNRNDGMKYFKFTLDYFDFVDEEDFKPSRWDVYLQFLVDGVKHKFRFKVDTNDLMKKTMLQVEKDINYQLYFYSTKYKNLSFALTNLTIKRDIVNYEIIKNNMLQLKGYSFIETYNFERDFVQKREIKIKNRETEETISFPLESIVFNKGEVEDEVKFLKDNSIFELKIPLNSLNNLIENTKEIFDFYVEIKLNDRIYERKLGVQKYKYYKDHALASGTVISGKNYYRHFLTITPRGNFKIETTNYSQSSYKYIKFGQYIDWFKNKNKDVWLIGERPDTAQDTGYHFFKYCRENFPEKEVYYVIDPSSKDIRNIEDLGNVILLGSEEHLKIAAITKVFIGSHDIEYFLPAKPFELYSYKKGKRVFLQHGVLGRKNVEYHKKYYKYPFNIFCVSSTPEKQLVMDSMKYSSQEVKITGLSRFDNLLKQHPGERSIIVIPTWREWLNNEELFIHSEYFERYRGLLQSTRLREILEKYNVKLRLYPHYRMQQFIEHFGELENKNVSVIKLGEKPVQQLLIESSLMITDFSSVSFDFNYMSKPIIFYHFDQDSFFGNGILRPINETFLGDICTNENEIVDTIEYYIENNFEEKETITEKKDLIFDYIDKNNCRRIYDEIISLLKD